MNKRILILKAYGSSDEPHDCNGICEQALLYGIEPVCKCVKDNEDLEIILYSPGLFVYIYLNAHGNSDGFASEDNIVNMSWQKLTMLFCQSKFMNEDSILILSCCRGGLMEVVYDLILTCQQICYVLGPRQSLTSADMHIYFGIFLYNIEIRGVDSIVACEKIKLATDQRFSCYDREEESISLMNYQDMHYGYAYD